MRQGSCKMVALIDREDGMKISIHNKTEVRMATLVQSDAEE